MLDGLLNMTLRALDGAGSRPARSPEDGRREGSRSPLRGSHCEPARAAAFVF